jgi:hypothetical protein
MNSISAQAEKEKKEALYNGHGGRDIIDGHIHSSEPLQKLEDHYHTVV